MKRRRTDSAPAPRKRPRLSRQKAFVIDTTEKKNLDVLQTGTIVVAQATALQTLLNACTQGPDTNERVGRQILMKSLEYRFSASLAPTTAGSSPIRLTIIYDRQSNGAAPAATAVFVSNNIQTMMNLNNSKRFKVLVDEIISEGLSVNGPSAYYCKGHRDFTAAGRKKGLPVEFQSNNDDITDITTGSIYSFVWQNGNLITAAPTNALYTRIRFSDK